MLAETSSKTPPERLLAWLIYATLLFLYHRVFGKFFPLPNNLMGHDYSLALPALQDGFYWFRNNGISAPWFTPSFCAGQPFFADPQSGFYSLPQWLSFVIDPVTASYLTLLISASLMFWGGYMLMRKVFLASIAAALLAGGLLMLNGFLPHRLLIGHQGYHGLSLLPWLSLLLLMPIKNSIDHAAAGIGAGLILAYWVQSGLGTLMIPAGLGVFVVALMFGMTGGGLLPFFVRSAIAAMVGLLISAAKLVAAFAFLSNFPRDFYLLPGAKSVFDAVVMALASLFLSSEHAFEVIYPRFANMQWTLMTHEWAFSFTWVTALLLLVLAWRQPPLRFERRDWVFAAGLLACLVLPLAINIYTPAWNALLKSLPIFGSASTLTRWLIIFIPAIGIGAALLLHRAVWSERAKWGVTFAAIAGIVALTLLESRAYYASQGHDISPLTVIDAQVREGKIDPKVHSLGQQALLKFEAFQVPLTGNDTFLSGVSQLRCYNPTFGYRLEKYSTEGLSVGEVLKQQNGYLNLKNPACYVFPKENNCQPGDLFREDQLESARLFVSYRPFPFEISSRQKLANTVSEWSVYGFGLAIVVWLFWRSSHLPISTTGTTWRR